MAKQVELSEEAKRKFEEIRNEIKKDHDEEEQEMVMRIIFGEMLIELVDTLYPLLHENEESD